MAWWLPGVTAGTAMLFLVSAMTLAQPASDASLDLVDDAADLLDLSNGEPTEAASYMDIRRLAVTSDGRQLAVRFEVSGDVPEVVDPLYTVVEYVLYIDTDGDDFQNQHLAISSDGGWHVSAFDYDTVFLTPLGDASVVDGALEAVVLLSELGFPSDMRFQGAMTALDYPDPEGEPGTFSEYEDRVPDESSEWRSFGESDAALPQGSAAPDVLATAVPS